MATDNEDDLSSGEEKRRMCRQLALYFRAQKVLDSFLRNTASLTFPAEWQEATNHMRRVNTNDIEASIVKMKQTKEHREMIMLAKKDASKLTLKEIGEGKITQ